MVWLRGSAAMREAVDDRFSRGYGLLLASATEAAAVVVVVSMLLSESVRLLAECLVGLPGLMITTAATTTTVAISWAGLVTRVNFGQLVSRHGHVSRWVAEASVAGAYINRHQRRVGVWGRSSRAVGVVHGRRGPAQ